MEGWKVSGRKVSGWDRWSEWGSMELGLGTWKLRVHVE